MIQRWIILKTLAVQKWSVYKTFIVYLGTKRWEAIDKHLQESQMLSKDYNLKTINTSQNWNDCINDTFIIGLLFHTLRQYLQKTKTLYLSIVADQAEALDSAMKSFTRSSAPTVAAVTKSESV